MINRFMPSIALLDVDSGLTFDEIENASRALNIQTTQQFAAAWNTSATVFALKKASDTVGIEIRLMDRPTIDGALGYHDKKPDGTPIAYVFVGLCREYGMSWTSCASHEILELLADPYLQLCVQMEDGIWDREVCDRVEADSYKINGVEVSNFNFPEAFEPPSELIGVRYDWLGLSTHPNEVRPNGYAQRLDPQSGWVQVGEMRPYRAHLKRIGRSRGHRRLRST